MILVDANVLIYAVNESSSQHSSARSWLEALLSGPNTVGFDWTVLLAFIRLTTNQRIFPTPLSIEEAMDTIDAWLAQPNAVVVTATRSHARVFGDLLRATGSAGNLVNDAHLAALAVEHDATIGSFDADFNRFDVQWEMPRI